MASVFLSAICGRIKLPHGRIQSFLIRRTIPRSTFHVPYSTFHIPRSTFHVQHSTFNIPRSTLHVQHSTFNIPHSTFHIPHSTYHIINSFSRLVSEQPLRLGTYCGGSSHASPHHLWCLRPPKVRIPVPPKCRWAKVFPLLIPLFCNRNVK